MRPEVTHEDYNSYIINAAALRSSEYHRLATGHHWDPVTPEEWESSIWQGLFVWLAECPPKPKGNGKKGKKGQKRKQQDIEEVDGQNGEDVEMTEDAVAV